MPGDRIKEISYIFDSANEDNVDDIRERLQTMRRAADDLAGTSEAICTAVGAYYDSLNQLRTSIREKLQSAKSSVIITVSATAVVVKSSAPIFSKDLDEYVYSAVSTSRFVTIVSSRPFAKLPDLAFHSTELRKIIDVPIKLMEEAESSGQQPPKTEEFPPPTLNKESEKYVRRKHSTDKETTNERWKQTGSSGLSRSTTAADRQPAIS